MTRASRSSLAWGREATVSLTQTEIMLVLAVVVLLLFLVKDEDLATAKDDLRETEERIDRLLGQYAGSEGAPIEVLEQADLAGEVKKILVRNESGPSAEPETPRLQPKDRRPAPLRPEDVEELGRVVKKAQKIGLETKPVDGAPTPKKEPLDQLDDAVATGVALHEHLSPERQRALQNALERGGEAVQELLSQWFGDLATTGQEQTGISIGDQVGFDPCWPRPGGRRVRRYYIAYDVTYANGRYAVKPHSDWQAGVPMVDEALAGPVSVLRTYPRTSVSPEELLNLGKRIDDALDPLREDGTYPPKCLLVATINEEASGAVAKFIRHEVGIYPITR